MSVEALVEHEYEAQQSDELTLRLGDVIKDVVKQPGGWWEGVLNGRKGMFPDNFVKELKRSKSPSNMLDTKPTNSVSQLAGQLANQGLRVDLSVNNGGGELRGGKKVAVSPTGPVGGKDVRERAVVVFRYAAENSDELTLEVGDTIIILQKELEDSGWWKGELNGKVGVFPDNFVELLAPDKSVGLAGGVAVLPKNQDKTPNSAFLRPSELNNKHIKSDGEKAGQQLVVGSRPVPTASGSEGKQGSLTDDHKAQMKYNRTGTLDSMNVEQKLSHITANRARAPQRRLPKQRDHSQDREIKDANGGDEISPSPRQEPPTPAQPSPAHKRDVPPPRPAPAWKSSSTNHDTPAAGRFSSSGSVAPPTAAKSQPGGALTPGDGPPDTQLALLRTEITHLRSELERLRAKHEREVAELGREVSEERDAARRLAEEVDRLKKLVRTKFGGS